MKIRILAQNSTTTLLIAFLYLFLLTPLYAKTQPKFTLTPTTATTATISASQTLSVVYRVTNKTNITRQLTMTPLLGVTQLTSGANVCSNPFVLAHNESCLLSLSIAGSNLPITSGPVICKTKGPHENTPDPFLCSQPSEEDRLQITLGYSRSYALTAPKNCGFM